MKNIIIAVLCIVIIGAIGLSVYTIRTRSTSGEPNPNVTVVTAPEQERFEKFSK